MSTDTIKRIFQSQFDYTTYCNEIVHNIFGCNDIATSPEQLPSSSDGDQNYFIGRMADADKRDLGFFYTRVAEGSDVRRKRVGLRKLIAPYLKYEVDAAIAVFDDGNHWRLSYICDMKEGVTAAKRFSYILGNPQGQYKTPLERLSDLGTQAASLRLCDIRDAFSVDALSKEFFDEYHRHYDIIVKELDRQGNSGALYHDYVKKMLGRIVFLHFLQKKGWLDGNQAFLRDLFFMQPLDRRADFLEKVLEPLFFGIFNTEPQNREKVFSEHNWDLSLLNEWNGGSTNALTHSHHHALHYLNGGLFEEDAVDKLHIKLPGSLFEDLFSFLASYNFTVDENDPDDAEVGVDPEMLGKIFESLLEDNKAKGAFYTPKEIVRYMCKESLIAYLSSCVSKLPCPAGRNLVNLVDSADASNCERSKANNNLQDSQDFASEKSRSIRKFVEHHEMQPELEPYRDILDAALRNVKICDPAIGSGAFPMGLLNELWRCREALAQQNSQSELKEQKEISDNSFSSDCEKETSDCEMSRVELKKQIIENNIYGVDIERGAIDIARLRFWLSIVVDAEEPEPLPNFDYKFMQGNSLIESYKGIDLSRISNRLRGGQSKSTQLLLGLDSDFSKKNLQRLMRDYFSVTDHKQKSSMRQAINDEVKRLISDFIGGTAADLDKLDPSANQDFFLWHTWFKDIFDNGGFDIVIGNPPYGAKLAEHFKQYIKDNYFSASSHKKDGLKGSSDTFVAFIELGHRILCNQGSLAFIVPMSVGSSDALTSLQYMIEKTCSEIKISSYSNRPKQIFDAACVRTSIFMIKKDMTPIRHIYTTKLNRRTENLTIKDIVDNLAYVDSKGQKIYGRYAKVGTESEVAILAKLLSSGKRIVDYYDEDGNGVYYRAAGGRYFNVVTNYPTFSSAEKSFKCRYTNIIGLILSSSYFYFYQQVYTDGLNIKRSEIENYPLPLLESIPKEQMFFLEKLYQRYLADIEKNASVRQTSSSSTHHVESFKEYKIVRSKAIIDEIDDYVGPLYGLTQEEINFIKNYELEFRMAGE
ncbi:MAG: N-6 DNA methylase [Bacteroidales bacterium]|nr:N-6 DNA methylase [Bacteroidales bacterium]